MGRRERESTREREEHERGESAGRESEEHGEEDRAWLWRDTLGERERDER